jgi:hypothetical protein
MFRIHTSVDKWGEKLLHPPADYKIENPIQTQFDLYYLFLISGLGFGRSESLQSANTKDLVRNVTEPFIEYRHLLSGVLLCSELVNQGHEMNREIVKRNVQSLIQADGQVFLSSRGIEAMNEYALGGFEEIRERLPNPGLPHDFLIWYHNDLLPLCFSHREWT